MPIVPPAPGRLSTITGWPHAALSRSPTMRAITSVALPGVNGTMIRIGFARIGAAPCASAAGAAAHAHADANAVIAVLIFVMTGLLW